jgi:hypothetical protein
MKRHLREIRPRPHPGQRAGKCPSSMPAAPCVSARLDYARAAAWELLDGNCWMG